MRLVIAGGTGFVGSALCARLMDLGHSLTILSRTRSPGPILSNKDWITWRPGSPGPWEETIDGADGVINLAGSACDNLFATELSISYLNLRVEDAADKELPLEKATAFIDATLKATPPHVGVLVHCAGAHSRSLAVMTAYLVSSCGLTLDKALLEIERGRGLQHINSGFMQQLRQWAAKNNGLSLIPVLSKIT